MVDLRVRRDQFPSTGQHAADNNPDLLSKVLTIQICVCVLSPSAVSHVGGERRSPRLCPAYRNPADLFKEGRKWRLLGSIDNICDSNMNGHSNANVHGTSGASHHPERDWWRQAVIYQIYPRSFADANGDGIGDLNGITSRVDYLHALGVDAVWLCPFYPSALKDGGCKCAVYWWSSRRR